MAISLILRHAWQRKSTQKHGKNTQLVLIWYSFRSTLPPHAPSRWDVLLCSRDHRFQSPFHWGGLFNGARR